MMRNDFDTRTSDMTFQEEVPENELHSKLGTSDIIYVDNGVRIRRTRFLIVLAIILILLSVISAFFGFAYLDKDANNNSGIVTKYDLFVTHSSSDYGGSIKSFTKYNSLDNAFAYDFSVSNNNPVSLKYSVDIENINFNAVNDISLINYALYRNDNVVSKGNLKNLVVNNVYTTSIGTNGSDKYVLKIWSSKLGDTLKFGFKVNIEV